MEEQGKMGMREYRKGNWTIQETMILIEAKKMDDERRKLSKKQAYHNIITTNTTTSPSSNINTSMSMSMSMSTSTSTSTSHGVVMKPVTELRWKWVEEYCWRKGCLRSQNQCNDKWDNLMRDYKKIRDFSRNLLTSKGGDNYDQQEEIKVKSYWEMDKVERKDKGLPTNMLPQIYQALFDVVEGTGSGGGSGSGSGSITPRSVGVVAAGVVAAPTQFLQLPPPSPPVPLRLEMTQLPFYSPQSQVQVQPQPQPVSLVLPTLELEASEQSQPESSAKRRRKEERVIEAPVREGTSTDAPTTTTTTTTTTPTLQDVSSAICRSASIISEAIQSNEENEKRRHKEIMHIHETRLRFEESRLEVTRQGFNGLNDAINKLANSILTWANTSHRSHQAP